MCLAIPSKVVKIDSELNQATVDTMGVKRVVGLDLLAEKVNIGEYVLIHIGYAINKIDELDAKETLKIYQDLITNMEKDTKEDETKEWIIYFFNYIKNF